jgi:phenylalanyl-tRNA synthetase beta chain
MNILIPDSWLRDYLKTDAKPKDIKRCLSLSGPSVERVYTIDGEIVYDIEVTTNRVDAYSIYGIAREAAVILPQFGFKTTLLPLPTLPKLPKQQTLQLHIQNDSSLCRRILAIKIENVSLKPSPEIIQKRLNLVNQRPINNLVDITNYVMWETGHPCHVFDYDRFPTNAIIVRLAKKGEKVITLDEKIHIMVGGEIVFDDGKGTIIDVPGIMGTANTVVTNDTKNILLFIENSDPNKIRFASMTHAIRSQAAVINEKDPDPELAKVAMERAIMLCQDFSGGSVASTLYDDYPGKQTSVSIQVPYQKLFTYLNTTIDNKKIESILTPLGFTVEFTPSHVNHQTIKQSNHQTFQQSNNIFTVTPPSWRIRDITIAEDIIEEIARIYGYHNIVTKLPDREPPINFMDPILSWEEEIKIRLRDFGYTELLTYSMISEKLMDIFSIDKTKAYRISNPLSDEWVYMRPQLFPSVLDAMRQNIYIESDLKVFELSMIYEYRINNLPLEKPTLIVAWTGDKFFEAKGLAETLFQLFGIEFPHFTQKDQNAKMQIYGPKQYMLGTYGSLGVINPNLLEKMDIHIPITRLYLQFDDLVINAASKKIYKPIPKFPPSFEDLALIIPANTHIGPIIQKIYGESNLIKNVELIDTYEHTQTIHITYQDSEKNLTDEDIQPIRQKILHMLQKNYGATLKTHN